MDIFNPHPKRKKGHSLTHRFGEDSPFTLRRKIERDAMRDIFPSHPSRKPIRRIKKTRND